MTTPVKADGYSMIIARLSAVVVGQVCDADGCRECVVRAEGWVDSEDAWAVGYHLPSDPLRGTSASGESGGDALLRHWYAMLHVVGSSESTDLEVQNAPQEKSQDAEGRR